MNIAILPGDGIGPEVMTQALKVLDTIATKFNHSFTYNHGLIGGAAYEEHNEHFPKETIQICKGADAILLGSVGGPVDAQQDPKWKNAEKNAILGLRKECKVNINLRPATVYPFLAHLCPLRPDIIKQGVDVLVIRELLHGIYFGTHETIGDTARDIMEYTEDQIRPVIEFACETAKNRRKKVTVLDKANVLDCSRLWRKVAAEVSVNYPDIALEYMYIDNAVMQIIKNPSQFDVVATSNLFGDIFSDAASVLPGSLGLMPSASLSSEVRSPKSEVKFGVYEPAGGSAPDIAGKGIANPIAQIFSAALMLRYSFHLEDEAQAIEQAVQKTLASGICTGDIAGGGASVTTEEMGDEICSRL